MSSTYLTARQIGNNLEVTIGDQTRTLNLLDFPLKEGQVVEAEIDIDGMIIKLGEFKVSIIETIKDTGGGDTGESQFDDVNALQQVYQGDITGKHNRPISIDLESTIGSASITKTIFYYGTLVIFIENDSQDDDFNGYVRALVNPNLINQDFGLNVGEEEAYIAVSNDIELSPEETIILYVYI